MENGYKGVTQQIQISFNNTSCWFHVESRKWLFHHRIPHHSIGFTVFFSGFCCLWQTLSKMHTQNRNCRVTSMKFGNSKGQEVNFIERSRWPAAAAGSFEGAAGGGQRSSRETQVTHDAFEPIPSEEVQDHFKSGTMLTIRCDACSIQFT
jgi:hypothetical protein